MHIPQCTQCTFLNEHNAHRTGEKSEALPTVQTAHDTLEKRVMNISQYKQSSMHTRQYTVHNHIIHCTSISEKDTLYVYIKCCTLHNALDIHIIIHILYILLTILCIYVVHALAPDPIPGPRPIFDSAAAGESPQTNQFFQ